MEPSVPGKKKREFPNSVVILFAIILTVTILTYIIPAGQFGTVLNEATGKEMVDAEQFEVIPSTPVSIFRMFVSITDGFVDGAPIIFLIAFGYYWVFSVVGSGAIAALINNLLHGKMKDSKLLIPIVMFIFALAGSTYGEFETVYGLIPIFVGLAIALGYDALVGLSMSGLAVAVGFAAATTNPFTIGIAQSYAELPIFSGLAYRWVIFFIFIGVSIFYTMRYAEKIKADPSKSLVAGGDYSSFNFADASVGEKLTGTHKLLLIGMVITIIVIVTGSLKLGWYISEMGAIFLISGIISQVIARKTANQIAESLMTAFAEMATAIVVVGLSRSILVVLQNGHIVDSVIYGLYMPMKDAPPYLVAQLMLVAENVINFFIPSGSGQAAAIMPIMIPLSDLVGVNRQIAVLAYQFGDGFSNLLWPTAGCAIMCGIAKIPLNIWYKFFLKLFAFMIVLQCAFLAIAVAIGYGPF